MVWKKKKKNEAGRENYRGNGERERERERESKGEETRGMSYNLKEIEILKINYNILSKIQYTKASP